jgi:hypothetical protein
MSVNERNTLDLRPPAPPRRRIRVKPIALALVAVVMAIAAAAFFLIHREDSRKAQFQAAQEVLSLPIYYPSAVPEGFKLDSSSIRAGRQIMQFTLVYADAKLLIVTEQPRPANMEQVVKTKQFDLAIGKAYIADLNGHRSGFVLAPKTLVIVSGTDNPSGDRLERVMRSLSSVQD